MVSSPRHETDGPRPAEEPVPLVLELSLSPGDPLNGTVGIADGPPAVPFHGWIDLMSAINSLRAAADKTTQPRQPAERSDPCHRR